MHFTGVEPVSSPFFATLLFTFSIHSFSVGMPVKRSNPKGGGVGLYNALYKTSQGIYLSFVSFLTAWNKYVFQYVYLYPRFLA